MSNSKPEPYTDEDVQKAIFKVKTHRMGTCFLVNDGWHLLTARHIVVFNDEPVKRIQVLVGEKPRAAQVKQEFKELDIALLQLLEEEIKVAPLKLSNETSHAQFRAAGFPSQVPGFWHPGAIVGPAAGRPGVYQITFEIDYGGKLEGLSGAPVLSEGNLVTGVVINHNVLEARFGEITGVKSFSDRLDFDLTPKGNLRCLVILSESEGKHGPTLKAAVNEGINLTKKKIGDELASADKKVSKTIVPVFRRATDLVANKESYSQAVRDLCRSEIAIFDVTGYEPAVMLLLGIRSVARRGITIASVGEAGAIEEAPFNIKEVNFISHSARPDDNVQPRVLIRDRILKGLEQSRDIQYLDLPAFDAVRNLPPDERNEIPVESNLLVMCSYGKEYENRNWGRLSDSLGYVVWSDFGLDAKPSISRVLDVNLKSPRLVSQMIYESIRRMAMCVVDWTEWRPNVFFEMGVRLSVSETGTVCIIEDKHEEAVRKLVPGQHGEPGAAKVDDETGAPGGGLTLQRLQTIAAQCLNLLKLFSPITYNTHDESKEPYEVMLERYRKSLNYEEEDSTLIAHTYKVISESIDVAVEAASTPVYRKLLQEADLLRSDESKGKSAVLYTENRELVVAFEDGITERLLAAWYYLRRRYRLDEIRSNVALKDDFVNIGQQLASRMRLINQPLAKNIFKVVSRIKAEGESGNGKSS